MKSARPTAKADLVAYGPDEARTEVVEWHASRESASAKAGKLMREKITAGEVLYRW